MVVIREFCSRDRALIFEDPDGTRLLYDAGGAVVRQHYNAKLAVINIGGTYTNGPKEAAYVVNELIKPNAVIASHANELATKAGMVIAGTRTDIFIKASRVPVYVPVSGRTMTFTSARECVAGCREK